MSELLDDLTAVPDRIDVRKKLEAHRLIHWHVDRSCDRARLPLRFVVEVAPEGSYRDHRESEERLTLFAFGDQARGDVHEGADGPGA